MMELSRGHGESAMKSQRVGDAWQEKKRRARKGKAQKATKRMGENCHVLTHRLPAWIEERGGQLFLIPQRAAAIGRIFALAIAGYGQVNIIKKLNEEGIKPFGRFAWSRGYIHRILNDRRALGEHQPRKPDGSPDGDAIKGYFPAVITENEWLAARGGQEQRYKKRGRVGEHVNVFAGLLWGAREGDAYYAATRPTGGNRSAKRMQRLLVNSNAIEGRAKLLSFPVVTFERAVFSQLREIDPHEILNGDTGPDEALVLAGELARVEASIASISANMDVHGESPTLFKRLRAREAQQRELSAKLAQAQQKAASPLSASWGEAQTLLSALDHAADPKDARLRLRATLRRIVDSIWILIVPRGRDRLAWVQIWFVGKDRRRDYLILHRPPKANASRKTPGCVKIESEPGLTAPIDLRKQADARKLESYLAAEDLEKLAAPMKDLPTLKASATELE
jgi:hypothetical protein